MILKNELPDRVRNALSVYYPISSKTATALSRHTRIQHFEHGDHLEKENQVVHAEWVVLSGILRTYVTDNNGIEYTTNFFQAGRAITPSLTRSLDDRAFHSLQVISPSASLLFFDKKGMAEGMDEFKDLEIFGYRVMMMDAFQRAEKEVVMMKSSGKEKLSWLRKHFPNLENEVPHYFIASYLGMTPTSLSRLRSGSKG
jgi:CRP-like cAMP-binding protein